jgi:hypothetical protein
MLIFMQYVAVFGKPDIKKKSLKFWKSGKKWKHRDVSHIFDIATGCQFLIPGWMPRTLQP